MGLVGRDVKCRVNMNVLCVCVGRYVVCVYVVLVWRSAHNFAGILRAQGV